MPCIIQVLCPSRECCHWGSGSYFHPCDQLGAR